jgi:hypothetical protein
LLHFVLAEESCPVAWFANRKLGLARRRETGSQRCHRTVGSSKKSKRKTKSGFPDRQIVAKADEGQLAKADKNGPKPFRNESFLEKAQKQTTLMQSTIPS